MKVTNKFNLPDPVFQALTHDDYTRGESNRSVTQLIDSPRYRILRKEHYDEIEYDVSEMIWIALGKAVHKMFEDFAGGKWLPEERLFAEIAGWTISGQVDIQEDKGSETVTLFDYKVTSVWSIIFGKESYAQQLNFYAWLARQAGRKVSGLKIIFVLRDWKMRDLLNDKKGEYPKAPIIEHDVPMWSDEEQDAYVAERVALHQDAEFLRLTGDKLPLCTDEERWVKESSWAVMKGANKRATRVFSCIEDAQRYTDQAEANGTKTLRIEERVESPNRCDLYCPVVAFCEQRQTELQNESKA